MMKFLHQLSSPAYYYQFASRWIPRLAWLTLILMVVGFIWGLWFSPADYQQGDSARIMYVHVPSAWMSMFVYTVMAVTALIAFVWHIKLAEIMIISNAYIGASFTFLALVTGSIWGKPMWGTWWEWDARLTFELILLFQYFGVIALYSAMDDKRAAARAAALLAMVGVVTVPIIHFSVEWWSSLHQPASVSRLDSPAIHASMLIPLFITAAAFKVFYVLEVLLQRRNELLVREQQSNWVADLLGVKD